MKKAKIMLSAIAVLAIVGSALAFKVKTSSNYLWVRDQFNVCTSVGNAHLDPTGTAVVGTIAGSTAPSTCDDDIVTKPGN